MEFNIKRCCDILQRKFFSNLKSLLIFAAIFFFVSAVAYFITARHSYIVTDGVAIHLRAGAMVITLVIIAGIWPFLELTEKKNRVFELIYPATVAEKFAVEVVFAFVVLPIFVLVLSILGLYAGAFASKLNMLRFDISVGLPAFAGLFDDFSGWEYEDIMLVIGLSILSFFGAVFFKKWRVLKTWACVGLICMTVVVLCAIVLYNYHNATGMWFPYSAVTQSYYDQSLGKLIVEHHYYYKGQELDYVPLFFNHILWNIAGTIFFAGVFCFTWILYKKQKA